MANISRFVNENDRVINNHPARNKINAFFIMRLDIGPFLRENFPKIDQKSVSRLVKAAWGSCSNQLINEFTYVAYQVSHGLVRLKERPRIEADYISLIIQG
ncbi:5922_t:CDS:1, partial [Entrophospora sp. SA101]